MSVLKFRCLQCNAKVLDQDGVMICSGCDATYPTVANTPIFTTTPRLYLAQCFTELYRDRQIDEQGLQQAKAKGAKRSELFFGALASNNDLLTALMDELECHFTKRELLDIVESRRDLAYTTRLDYLKRDWAWQPENEQEISVMVKRLSAALQPFNIVGNAVFMGGGMGRVAVELALFFEEVFIVDYSVTMAFLFSRLIEGDIRFHHITRKNLKAREELAKEMTASFCSPTDGRHRLEGVGEKVHYLVAQADNAPFLTSSVDALFSIYFSDVLPLSQYLPEVKRVLKPGGVFVHFGPLDYHFDDTEAMKSVDEFIDAFRQEDFELLVQDFVESGHIDGQESMFNKRYTNALLVMQWNPNLRQLDESTVLRLAQDYTVKTSVKKETGVAETSLVFEKGAEYEGAETMVTILGTLDGQRTIREVLDFVGMDDDSADMLIHIFTDLMESGILAIVED